MRKLLTVGRRYTPLGLAPLLGLFFLAGGCTPPDPAEDDPTARPTDAPAETQLVISATTLDFGTDLSEATTQSLTVKNLGPSELLLTVTLPDNPSSQYSVDAEGADIPDTLLSGEEVPLTVTFQPLVEGDADGLLRIDTNDAVQPRVDIVLTASAGTILQEDLDDDGYTEDEGDCDDEDASVHPKAAEPCDGIDNDCDGDTDEEGASTFYLDQDGDAHGDPATDFTACKPGKDAVTVGDDCDDSQASVFPGAPEVCDGVDNNCDTQIDEGLGETWYLDRDLDGYGDSEATASGCTELEGYVPEGGDCNDGQATVYPGAPELCDQYDNDCDGEVDEEMPSWYADVDGDGFGDPLTEVTVCDQPEGFVGNPDDCDDADAYSYPGATEICDGLDNDCNGEVDELELATFYPDADQDGYGSPKGAIEDCAMPEGYVANAEDCNDDAALAFPGADEICDSIDNDCDGLKDEEGVSTFYRDFDQDGHGDATVSQEGCNNPNGYVASSDDCNDRDANISPSAEEKCDNKDNNCNDQVDEGALKTFYLDADKDGFGDADTALEGCTAPANYVSTSGDCNDLDRAVYPTATEVCDSKDNDCDDSIDENVQQKFFADDDRDGYGNPDEPQYGCVASAGLVTDNTDCNDASSLVNPGQSEQCDGLDNDCNDQIDEGVLSTFFKDADADGYGSPASSIEACTAPPSYVSNQSDCNDASSTVHPLANELCDGADNDCDGTIDEGVKLTWYTDQDQDQYGDADQPVQACTLTAGLSANKLDCDDEDSAVHPGASEACDGQDNDCDGLTDEAGDPNQTAWYKDADFDGYGVSGTPYYACTVPAGYASNTTDCDDTDKNTYPDAKELCGGKDNDCDGLKAPGAKPVAGSTAPLCLGGTLNLTASTVTGASYSWTGPNSFTSTIQNPSISSVSSVHSGTYKVSSLIDGCASEPGLTEVTVISASSSFTWSPDSPALNNTVTFTPNASSDSWNWTFQGGTPSTSTAKNPTVSWSTPGTYSVSLTAKLSGCSSNTVTQQITVISTMPSCKDYKTANPSATSGVYKVDPDGSGSVAPYDVYCDMTTAGGGWTLLYFVDAAHFDGWVANNYKSVSTPPLALNAQGDMWNVPSTYSWTESLFACTQQNDAAGYYWTYTNKSPITWFTNTSSDYMYQSITNTSTNGPTATCMSTHKAENSYGFIVLESASCGSCSNMLYGNYHYSSGGQCNGTSNTYGTYTSAWRSVAVGYPLCNRAQTSNGKFWIGVR